MVITNLKQKQKNEVKDMEREIKFRRYQILKDFQSVYDYLEEVYDQKNLNSYLLSSLFEYGHTHPYFDHQGAHHMGIWEDNDQIVAVVAYEMRLGEAFLSTRKNYEYLLKDMLIYAEKELSVHKNDQFELKVWIVNHEHQKRDLLKEYNYEKVYEESVNIFDYSQPFPSIELPKDYKIISLEDENDLYQIHQCLWKGFNHGDDVDPDYEGRLLMQTGPHFRKDLTTIIKNPDGNYSTYAGMWIDQKNKYAYLEPLATIPTERKKGLGQIALIEGMKKTKQEGATYCFGGSIDFYKNMGFKEIAKRELWKRTW